MSVDVKRFEISATDGLILRGEVFGDRISTGTPVFCLPGLTRSSRDFHPLAERLASDPDNPRFVMILNSRGRGPSDYDLNPDNYNILTEANDALQAMNAAGMEEAVFLGTSRGGLLTMAIAALQPGRIAGAILNDIGPVLDMTGLARIKTYLSKARPVTDWHEAVEFVKMANFGQFPALDEEDWEIFTHMSFRDRDGKPARDFDAAIVKGLEGVDISTELPTAWPQFLAMSHAPVLVLRGEYSDILSEQTAREMVRRHPDCQYLEVLGHGHAPLFIKDNVNDMIADFLVEIDSRHGHNQCD